MDVTRKGIIVFAIVGGVSLLSFSIGAAPIEETTNPLGWILSTDASMYRIVVDGNGYVLNAYYGSPGRYLDLKEVAAGRTALYRRGMHEVPFRGGWVEGTPAVEVIFADHTRDADLVYDSHEILDMDEHPCLRIDLKDKYYGLRVSSYWRVFPEEDVIEKWLVLENAGDSTILVENAQSGSVWLPVDEYDLFHFSGMWGREFLLQKTQLTPGVKTIQTRSFVMHENPPWFAVGVSGETNEDTGEVWFGSLAWSGNWRFDFEKTFHGNVQAVGGINFWDTSWTLGPGEKFETPKAVYGFSPDGLNGASNCLHEFIRDNVLRASFREKLRPVLYNSWYATTFHVNEEQQVELARIAKEIGVELFVIDDGWFKGRKDDHAGLGDWVVDKEKFPNGLKAMIERINDLGLDFGLWVEPEMVNPDSDLYRAHPDWVFHYPHRKRREQRNQLMLNLARDDVYEYLLDSLSKLLDENNIRFIKWDRNRSLTEPGWPEADPETQREVRIRYVHNLYRLIDELQRRFPDVLFESCSGGGGRVDLGILSRMDQVWTSDNTDPSHRVMIQDGFLHAFPSNLMVSWVTDESWQGLDFPLAFRFHVCMSGVLGVGSDLTKWSQEERDIASNMIAQYKDIREIVQEGEVYRLISPFEQNRSAIEYVSRDGSEAVVFFYSLLDTLEGSRRDDKVSPFVRLHGLDPDAAYRLSADRSGVVDGRTLMNIGIPWFLRGSFTSGIVTIRKE